MSSCTPANSAIQKLAVIIIVVVVAVVVVVVVVRMNLFLFSPFAMI